MPKEANLESRGPGMIKDLFFLINWLALALALLLLLPTSSHHTKAEAWSSRGSENDTRFPERVASMLIRMAITTPDTSISGAHHLAHSTTKPDYQRRLVWVLE